MKTTVFKVLFVSATIILPGLTLAQQLAQNKPQTVWGAVSNGICAGIFIKQSDWGSSHEDDLYCNMELGNMTTNLMWAWVPPFEQRYKIELRGPDGKGVRQLKPLFHSQKTLGVGGLRPLSTNSTSASLDWFFLKDTFDVRTNGRFTLVASVRVNVFTNCVVGLTQMQRKPVYYLLPPVTNTFNILPKQTK